MLPVCLSLLILTRALEASSASVPLCQFTVEALVASLEADPSLDQQVATDMTDSCASPMLPD